MKDFFRTIWAFTIRDAIQALSYKLSFVMQLVAVMFSVLSIYFMSRLIRQNPSVDPYGGYLAWGLIGMSMSAFFTAGYSSFSTAIRQEQTIGTLESLLMTPATLTSIVIASSAWNFIWTTISSTIMILFGILIFHIHVHGSILSAIPLIVLTTLTFTCVGIISACFTLLYKRGDPFRMLVTATSFMLGGVVYPVSELPKWLQKFSVLLPITHGLNGLRNVLLKGAPFSSIWPQILILCVFVALGFPISLWCFDRAVRIARREGSLLHY